MIRNRTTASSRRARARALIFGSATLVVVLNACATSVAPVEYTPFTLGTTRPVTAATAAAAQATPVRKVDWLHRSRIEPGTTGGKYSLEVVIDKDAKIGGIAVDEATSLDVGLLLVDAANNGKADDFIKLLGSQEQKLESGSKDGIFKASVPAHRLSEEPHLYAVAISATLKLANGTVTTKTIYVADDQPRELTGDTLGWGDSIGRLSYGFLGGAIISNDANEFDFSEVNLYLRLMSDVTLEERIRNPVAEPDGAFGFDFDEVHLVFDAQLTTVPVKATDASNNDFLSTKQTFRSSIGLDWRVLQYRSWDEYDLTFGPSVQVGFDTFTESRTADENRAELESVNDFWGVGVRFTGQAPNDAIRNPLPRHYGSVHYGDYTAIGTKRLAFDAGLMLGENSGFFIGLNANIGQGKDDVRLIVGFASNPSTLFDALAGLIPPGLKGG